MAKAVPHSSRPMVELVKVTKVYIPNIVALQNVSLSISQGEMVFFTGASGAGKSTLLKLICCLEAPTKGVVEVAGRDVGRLRTSELQQLRQQMGVAYQDFKLLPRQTVAQNVAMALEVTYQSQQKIKKRTADLLDILHLSNKRKKLVGKLSRGEQQRVALARAAANSPALLLADEPTGNLDAAAGDRVMQLFQHLREEGSTIVVATHDQNLFQDRGHRVFHLHQGRLTERTVAQEKEEDAYPESWFALN